MDFEKDIALIKDVLTNGLSQIKPKPKIWIEVNTFGLDVWIISKGFAKMMLHERYNLVFSLFDQKLDWEIEKKISSLLIYTPKEIHYEMPWENQETRMDPNEDKTESQEGTGRSPGALERRDASSSQRGELSS